MVGCVVATTGSTTRSIVPAWRAISASRITARVAAVSSFRPFPALPDTTTRDPLNLNPAFFAVWLTALATGLSRASIPPSSTTGTTPSAVGANEMSLRMLAAGIVQLSPPRVSMRSVAIRSAAAVAASTSAVWMVGDPVAYGMSRRISAGASSGLIAAAIAAPRATRSTTRPSTDGVVA